MFLKSFLFLVISIGGYLYFISDSSIKSSILVVSKKTIANPITNKNKIFLEKKTPVKQEIMAIQDNIINNANNNKIKSLVSNPRNEIPKSNPEIFPPYNFVDEANDVVFNRISDEDFIAIMEGLHAYDPNINIEDESYKEISQESFNRMNQQNINIIKIKPLLDDEFYILMSDTLDVPSSNSNVQRYSIDSEIIPEIEVR